MTDLREYQRNTLQWLRDSYKSGRKRVLLVSPTGSGKTRMAVEVVILALRLKETAKVLWVTHRRELLYQAVERLKREGISNPGIILANETTSSSSRVQVASVDTLRARSLRPEATLVIWDEAHHIAAETWAELQSFYPDAHHLGLTATPERGDGKPLGDFFDDLVESISVAELQALGYLVPCVVEVPPRRLAKHQMAQTPFEAWKEKTEGLQTILYASDIKEATRYAQEFQSSGVRAEVIDFQLPDEQRKNLLKRFEQGKITVLCNVNILTEGWDCPPAEVCIVARSVGSVGLWIQMIGRVLRTTPNKAMAYILDLTGNVYDHGPPDLPREFSRKSGIINPHSYKLSEYQCRRCNAVSMRKPCPSCYASVSRDPRGKEITGDQLQPFEDGIQPPTIVRPRLFEDEPAKEREQQLQLLLTTALARNYKPGWIRHEFRLLHKAEIPDDVYADICRQYLERAPHHATSSVMSSSQPLYRGDPTRLLEALVQEAERDQKPMTWVWETYQKRCGGNIPRRLYEDMKRRIGHITRNKK
jgi:DNA repair protein RadD